MGADWYICKPLKEQRAKYQDQYDAAIWSRDHAKDKAMAEIYQARIWELWELMDKDFYFRDSYNDSNLFWQLGLQYWHNPLFIQNEVEISEEDCQSCDSPENCYCRCSKCEDIRDDRGWPSLIPQTFLPQQLPALFELINNAQFTGNWPFSSFPNDTEEQVIEYFTKKKQELLDFIDMAVELGEPVDVSY